MRTTGMAMGWRGVIAARLFVPAVSFVITILVARLWGQSVLAQCATVWSWLGIAQYFALFGLPDYVAKEAGRCPENTVRFLEHGLLFLVTMACTAALLMGSWAACSNYSLEVKRSLVLAGLSLPACACTAMCQAICTALKRISYIILSLVGEALIFLVGALAALFLGGGITALFGALLTARMMTALTYLAVMRGEVTLANARSSRAGSVPALKAASSFLNPFTLINSFNPSFGRGLMKGAAIFGLTSVCGQVFLRLDIVVLSLLCTMALLGPYSAAARIVELCLIFPLTFCFVNLAPAAHFFQTSRGAIPRALQTRATELFYVVLAVASGGMLFADTILSLPFGAAYVSAAPILRLLLVVFLVMSAEAVLSMSCQAAGYHQAVLWIAAGRLGVGVVCQWLFVQRWGLLGAPLASLTAMAFSFGATCFVVEKHITHFDWPGILKRPLLVCAFAVSVALLVQGSVNRFLWIGVFVACYGFAVAVMEGWWRLLQRKSVPVTG